MRSSGRERVMGLFGITKHKSHRSRIGENDGFYNLWGIRRSACGGAGAGSAEAAKVQERRRRLAKKNE